MSCLVHRMNVKILGPDVKLRLQKSLAALQRNTSYWDILLLGRCWDRCGEEFRVEKGADLMRIVRAKCFHAFGVSRKGAAKIIEYLTTCPSARNYTCGCAADCAPLRIEDPAVYAISPALFVQSRRLLEGGDSSSKFSKLDRERGIKARASNKNRQVFGIECTGGAGYDFINHFLRDIYCFVHSGMASQVVSGDCCVIFSVADIFIFPPTRVASLGKGRCRRVEPSCLEYEGRNGLPNVNNLTTDNRPAWILMLQNVTLIAVLYVVKKLVNSHK